MAAEPGFRNLLLASLPEPAAARLRPMLRPVELTLRDEICRPGDRLQSVWFPQAGMISLVKLMQDGMRSEVGLIGREGVFGTAVLAGTPTSFSESVVQLTGSALRISAADFRAEVDGNGPFRTAVLRYNEALLAQVMQTAACNNQHGLEQRLARWLLMALDRADGSKLVLTQEFMAMMLGVHRPSVTVTAGILQRGGSITYSNGVVTVLDRARLEASACECYAAVRQRFESVLGLKTA